MHAYLIIGKDEVANEKEISLLLKEIKAKRFDTTISKIKDVRDLSAFTKLGQSKPIAFVIKDIDSASLEALNAFLKSLEEPLNNINYILSAKGFSNIPETILSRCKILRVEEGNQIKSQEVANEFLNYTLSEKMNYISGIKTKDDAQTFAQTMIVGVHSLLSVSPSLKYAKILKSLEFLLSAIKANGNVQLQLTNFIISLN